MHTHERLICLAITAACLSGCGTTRTYPDAKATVINTIEQLGAEKILGEEEHTKLVQRMPAMGMQNRFTYAITEGAEGGTRLCIRYSSRPDPIWLLPLAVFEPSDVCFSRARIEREQHALIVSRLKHVEDFEQSDGPGPNR